MTFRPLVCVKKKPQMMMFIMSNRVRLLWSVWLTVSPSRPVMNKSWAHSSNGTSGTPKTGFVKGKSEKWNRQPRN